jgi:hypothetical protein
MPSRRSPLVVIALFGCLGLLLLFAPIPLAPANTSTGCQNHLPPGALFGCGIGMNGYGSTTYDLFGYGGFLGPIPGYLNVQSNLQYSLWF